ncbi:acyl-homoserine-lactone synthase [Oryzicola mucosus]|uniref:Acyl-homoserine-lactone synthase n=1 Tax=Oryzicola mucosus TaxID=2767425 RepID=A0A8J6PQE2_9HYPH|nr:acyl-homoserine-lactone synthase [Oryzicola mucosus]MBD0416827.1 GNAT family N-acetyltransferase [Oryzicola mucosus]
MFKIRVIDWNSRKEHAELLEAYFRLRHKIYVETRGWTDVERPIPFEIDAYDNRHAVYLVGIDKQGELMSGTRLVPTTEPHLLADIFPILARGEPPRQPGVFEWTRFFVAPKLRTTGASSKASGIMLTGLLEYCLHSKISVITVVCEAFWPERLRALGWHLKNLGEVLKHVDGDIVGLAITVTPAMVETTKNAYGLPADRSVLESHFAK